MYYQILEPHPSHPVKKAIQAGAELGQAQDKLKVIDDVGVAAQVKLELKLRFKLITASPGPKFFLTQHFLDLNFFLTHIFFYNPKFFLSKIIS